MVAAPQTHTYTRASKKVPCPLCGAHKGCSVRDDGAITCLHTASAWPTKHGPRGWWHPPENRAGAGTRTHDRGREQAQPAPTVESRPAADPQTLNAVYTDLLGLCPLVPQHRALLVGFSDQQAARYGSLPDRYSPARRRVLEMLSAQHGEATLLTVPGFIHDKWGHLEINAGAGIILPTRDPQGRIIGVDVRRDETCDPSEKYYKLSSTKHGGPGPGSPAHVAQPAGGVTDTRTIYITEGIKKADLLADATGCIVISVPGIGCTERAAPVLEALQGDVVVIALDWDDPAREQTCRDVARARQELARIALERGYAVRIATWEHSQGKGVDDVLIGGETYTVQRYTAATVGGPGSQTELLGQIIEVVHNRTAHHTYKLGLIAALVHIAEAAQHGPPPDAQGCYPIQVRHIAQDMDIGADTVGSTLQELAGLGYLTRRQVFDPALGKTVTSLGPGAKRLERGDAVPIPPRLLKHRARNAARRCAACLGPRVPTATHCCADCGHISTAAEAKAAAAATEVRPDGSLVDTRTGEVFPPPAGRAKGRSVVTTDRGPDRARGPQHAAPARPVVPTDDISNPDSPVVTTGREPAPASGTDRPVVTTGRDPDASADTDPAAGGIHAAHLGAWLEECFQRAEQAPTSEEAVRRSYRRRCRGQHEEPCTWPEVAAFLRAEGFERRQRKDGAVWVGLVLRPEASGAPSRCGCCAASVPPGQLRGGMCPACDERAASAAAAFERGRGQGPAPPV